MQNSSQTKLTYTRGNDKDRKINQHSDKSCSIFSCKLYFLFAFSEKKTFLLRNFSCHIKITKERIFSVGFYWKASQSFINCESSASYECISQWPLIAKALFIFASLMSTIEKKKNMEKYSQLQPNSWNKLLNN